MRRFIGAIVLVLALGAGRGGVDALWAQSGISGIDLGEFEVNAEAESPLILVPAGRVLLVTGEEIARSGAATVADVLESTPSVVLNRYGPNGASSTLSLRGSTSNQVLVILDGQRLNDARQGSCDLSLIPTESIDRIEILQGGASAAYGPDALGGVLVITTKRAKDNRLSVQASNSAYPTALSAGGTDSLIDGQRLVAMGSTVLGQLGLNFSASGERANNAYPYGGDALRENADLLSGNAHLGLDLPLLGGLARGRFTGGMQKAGVPGSLSWASDIAWQEDDSFHGSFGWSSDALVEGLLDLDVQCQTAFSRLKYNDGSTLYTHDLSSSGLEIRGSRLFTEGFQLGFGATTSYEAAESTSFAANTDGQPTRVSAGGYLEPILLVDRFKVSPILRFDWTDDYAAGLSAMLGLVYEASDIVELKVSAGSSYRAPTFNELYWPYEDWGSWGSYSGNPDLKPERAWSGELGADLKLEEWSCSISGFGRWVDDLIKTSYVGLDGSPQNVDRAFMPGFDLDVAYVVDRLRVSGGYEFLYPLDMTGAASLGEGSLMKDLSMHQIKMGGEFSLGPVVSGLSAHYWSDRETSSASLPGAFILDVRTSVRFSKSLEVSLIAENLLNEEYELSSGYPMPGLRITTTVTLEL